MTLKNIGVFVDATPEGEKRIDYAATLAHQCGAHLAGIHVVSAVRPEYRSDYYVIGEKAIRALLAERKAADEAATSQELKGYASPEKLLLASGSPVLVIPSGWKSESIGNKILVGWNASREARRAVADALPFLVAASSVTLLVVDSEERAGRHGEEPGADIALYLARHGARVEVEQVLSKGTPVADIILSFARDHGMDLIVIGAYSHARSVEMLFGGVTRTLLKLAPVPLLMSR